VLFDIILILAIAVNTAGIYYVYSSGKVPKGVTSPRKVLRGEGPFKHVVKRKPVVNSEEEIARRESGFIN